MNLYVPLDRSPDIGRKCLCQIGGSADVETGQSMYPSSTPHQAQTEGESMGLASSRPLVTSQHHVRILTGFLPLMLKCCGGVQRQPGVADTMSEAYLTYCPVDSGCLAPFAAYSRRRTLSERHPHQ